MDGLDDVKTWLRSMSAKGIYGGSSARIRITALEQLSSVLGPDEPKDPKWLLEHVDAVARRWATRRQANPGTANSYLARVRSSLKEYLEYQADPAGFGRSSPSAAARSNNGFSQRKRRSDFGDRTESVEPVPALDEQTFLFSLTKGRRAKLSVPTMLTEADIKIIRKQIELLELQAQSSKE